MPNRDDILEAARAACAGISTGAGAVLTVSRVVGWAIGQDEPGIPSDGTWLVAVYTDGPETASVRDSTQIEWSLPLTVQGVRRYGHGTWTPAEHADGTSTRIIRRDCARMLDEIKVALGATLGGYAISVDPVDRDSDDGFSPAQRVEAGSVFAVLAQARFRVRHHETRGRTP